MQQLSLKGRDYLGLLKLLPGVLDTASATGEAPGNRALIGLFMNGNRQGTLNLNLDGISTLSLGGGHRAIPRGQHRRRGGDQGATNKLSGGIRAQRGRHN